MKIESLWLTALFLAFGSVCFAQSKTLTFKRYAVTIENLKTVKVNLQSHRNARRYRTNLRRAAKGAVNFAGHFIVTTWGCGTGCTESAIINARDGRVFFPKEFRGITGDFCEPPQNAVPVDSLEMSNDEYAPIIYQADSRLLVLNGRPGSDYKNKNSRCGTYYFEWTGKRFKRLKFKPGKTFDGRNPPK